MYQIEARQEHGAVIFMRNSSGGRYSQNLAVDIPAWLRVTRNGMNLAVATSSDGRNWNTIDQNTSKFLSDTWVGLLIGNDPKPVGKAVLDQVTFRPEPSLSEIIPSGVLLRSGTYLAGNFAQFDLSGSDPIGKFSRNGKEVSVPAAQIAMVALYPTTRRQISELGSQIGLFMKNGDFMAGDIESIFWGDHVRINSLILGETSYDASAVQAFFFMPCSRSLLIMKSGSTMDLLSAREASGSPMVNWWSLKFPGLA